MLVTVIKTTVQRVAKVISDRSLSIKPMRQNYRLHLSLPVDSDQSTGSLVWSGDENGVSTDAIHEDTHGGLEVVHVDVAVLRHHEHHAVLGRYLNTKRIVAK